MIVDLASPVGQVARAVVPMSCKLFVGHKYYRREFYRYLQRTLRTRHRLRDTGPMAPPELVATEALMREGDLMIRSRPDWYFGSGFRDALRVLLMLERNDLKLAEMKSMVEFGCGSARVLRHFRNVLDLDLYGTDANPKPVEWCRRALPGIDFRSNRLEPPLELEAGAVDVVYALSVFTHIPLQWQRSWLEELRRVLRPGGYLLCTVTGAAYVAEQLSGQRQEELRRTGDVMLSAMDEGASYSSQVLGSWDVFQTREEVRRSFSAVFDILEYTAKPFGQDILVLRKN